MHTGNGPFECQICGSDFSQKGGLTRHINSVHKGEKPYICHVCGKVFSQSSNLTEHIKVHTGVKKCLFCGMDFAYIHELAQHMNTTHIGKYMCPKCGRLFITKFVMELHWLSCPGE